MEQLENPAFALALVWSVFAAVVGVADPDAASADHADDRRGPDVRLEAEQDVRKEVRDHLRHHAEGDHVQPPRAGRCDALEQAAPADEQVGVRIVVISGDDRGHRDG